MKSAPALLAWLLACGLLAGGASADQPRPVFAERGYYITQMRMPTLGLEAWRQIVDDLRADGGNLLLLWTGGGFRSRRFPVTWGHNADHENVRADFNRQLIDYAHARDVRVLLGFTPFAYDGVNRLPLEQPRLAAKGRDGKPAPRAGIFCWGQNLCPSQPESQQFMLDYVRELCFDFYPNADGLLIESSDYGICHCPDCGERYFEKEFQFVQRISRELWARRPAATIVVYPHYFSHGRAGVENVAAAGQPFDRRWTLFFTPHSTRLDPELIRQAASSIWSDDSPALKSPAAIQAAAQRARAAGMTGYVPSLEAFSFVPTEPEEGQAWLIGKRQVPLGFGWVKVGQNPYRELPVRVNRIAYRHFTADPDLPQDEFRRRLGREVFGPARSAEAVEDLLTLHRIFARERTWCQASPLAMPERVRAARDAGRLSAAQRAAYRGDLESLAKIAARHRDAAAERGELARISAWVLAQWTEEQRRLIAD